MTEDRDAELMVEYLSSTISQPGQDRSRYHAAWKRSSDKSRKTISDLYDRAIGFIKRGKGR